MYASETSGTGRRAAREAVILATLARPGRRAAAEQSLDELAGLARAAGGHVVSTLIQERPSPDPATFLGRGKVEVLAAACSETGAELVIFDEELSPAQLRNLEAALGCAVIDRTQLILDIFARRARTREGKGQVELAQLRYLLPRLVGARTALSRLGGGIGTRGPGETKLEADRRRIRQRIHAIAEDLDAIRQRRGHLRERRHKASMPTVALVGYTNAGKTTLFNALTGQAAEASDALFVTLDPLVRKMRLPDRRTMLVSDTVGFIDRLPHTLVAAFRATLEEVSEADLLLHVIDAASPDRARHMAAVQAVLEEVGAGGVPVVPVLNKCDAMTAAERHRLEAHEPGAVSISALTGEGLDDLRQVVAERLALDTLRVAFEFNPDEPSDRERMARVYQSGRVVTQETHDGRIAIEAEVPRRLAAHLGVPSLPGGATPHGVRRKRTAGAHHA